MVRPARHVRRACKPCASSPCRARVGRLKLRIRILSLASSALGEERITELEPHSPHLWVAQEPILRDHAALRPLPPALDSRIAFSRLRSFRLARRIAAAMSGAPTLAKPDGSPRLLSIIRVPPDASSSHV
jgi:hypothetical protein